MNFNLRLAFLLATAQAFPLIPLYPVDQTVDSAPHSLWNGMFNPLDHALMALNQIFGFASELTENVVNFVIETTEEGYTKSTETVELINEAGQVVAVETRYTIDIDKTKLDDDQSIQDIMTDIIEDHVLPEIEDKIPSIDEHPDISFGEEGEETLINFAGNNDEKTESEENNQPEGGIFFGIFPDPDYINNLISTADRDLEQDQEVEEFEPEDKVIEEPSTEEALDLETQEMLDKIISSDMPDWMKDEMVNNIMSAVKTTEDMANIDEDDEDEDDDEDDIYDYEVEDEDEDDEDDYFGDEADYEDTDDEDLTPEEEPTEPETSSDHSEGLLQQYSSQVDMTTSDQLSDRQKDELESSLEHLNWPQWMKDSYFSGGNAGPGVESNQEEMIVKKSS